MDNAESRTGGFTTLKVGFVLAQVLSREHPKPTSVRTYSPEKQQQYGGDPVESKSSVMRTPYPVVVQYATTVEYLETDGSVLLFGFSFVPPFLSESVGRERATKKSM